ncbi:MAG TPA: NAD(P)H-hydrate dehydratase [Burkholderiales bacterium]|nr:NAD(P)H-hydrate dehydratase [Burkholderiales bacterium]
MSAGEAEVVELDDATLRAWPLPLPERDGDKEERGRVLVVAGCRQIIGAAVLAATAALRAGAGKVAIATPESIARSIGTAVPESRVFALPERDDGSIEPDCMDVLEEIAPHVKSVLIGPGLPYVDATRDLAAALLETFAHAGVVLDAGAMGVVKARGRFASPVLLTPHAGEMASLEGREKDEIESDPIAAAVDASGRWNAVVALKGAITHIATPDTRVWRNSAGNPGLATSGSGDVLSGVIAGLLARGAPLEQAAAWGVALHARAGDRLAARIGPFGYLARELPGEVPALMAMLQC